MGHKSLIALARLDSRSSFVSLSRAWMVGSSEFSNLMPCLSIVLVTRASNLGMPRPPSLLLQYKRPFGVLIGRWRTTLMWFRITWSMARMVEMVGVTRTALCRKWGMIWEAIRDSFLWGFSRAPGHRSRVDASSSTMSFYCIPDHGDMWPLR